MATYCRHPYIQLRGAILCQPAVWWVTSAEQSRSIFGKRRSNYHLLPFVTIRMTPT